MIQKATRRSMIVGSVALVLLVVAFMSWRQLEVLGAPRFTAAFSEAGGLAPGDSVVASGLVVGKVSSVDLRGNHVRVEFEVTNGDVHLGNQTTAAIVSQTVLGRRALSIHPAGPGELSSEIPIDRTTAPYAVEQALGDLSSTSEQIDVNQLGSAMGGTGRLLENAAPEIRPLMTALYRVAQLVNGRGSDLKSLLASTAGVSDVVASRELQIRALIADSGSLLTTVDQRRTALENLFADTDRVAVQLQGLIEDNRRQLGPAFAELNQLLGVLRQNRGEIADGVSSAAPVLRELGEVVAAFPGFNVWIPNLVATNLVPTLPELLGGTSKP